MEITSVVVVAGWLSLVGRLGWDVFFFGGEGGWNTKKGQAVVELFAFCVLGVGGWVGGCKKLDTGLRHSWSKVCLHLPCDIMLIRFFRFLDKS